jgi:spore coat polysaccharide biosynthesis predicted glycosyltransferase SpsG
VPAVGGKLLVTLGGADPQNLTGALVEALGPVGAAGVDVLVVVGGANPRRDEIRDRAAESGLRVAQDVADMSELLAWADVGLSSGGTTVWEMAFLGLPAVVGAVAPIERLLLAGLEQADLFVRLGWLADRDPAEVVGQALALLADPERRRAMSSQARALVDGLGAERVVAAMRQPRREGLEHAHP